MKNQGFFLIWSVYLSVRIIYPIIFAITLVAIFGLIEILLIRTLNKNWWKYAPIKWASILLPLFGIIAIILWFVGFLKQADWLYRFGAFSGAATLVLLLGLMISLPLSGVLHVINRWLDKRKRSWTTEKIDKRRRILLKGSAAALPLVALSLGTSGLAGSFYDARVYVRKMTFPDLPPQLEGIRILHLTDSHLWIYRHLGHIEEILSDAEQHNPDLILMTGDIADDLALLPDVLKLVENFGARLGCFAVPGNHEYYRGIEQFKEIHRNSTIPLLIGSGETINIDGASLYIAGADDPRTMHGDVTPILKKTIDQAVEAAPADSFKILMSHRPEGLDPAAERQIHLTLSGHTHGGQVGVGGRSFFENIMPERYLWGIYKSGKSQMYVSAGIGHWFPFRLGCPPEAPVIELTSK